MKNAVVIGLGNFGYTIAHALEENGIEVLGVDSDREVVQKARDQLTQVLVADVSKRPAVESLRLKDFDCAIVSIGQELTTSILVSLYLREAGPEKVIVRAISEDHARILEMLGVDEIVFPERDMALRIGKTLSMKNALDYLPLSGDYAIMDVRSPASFFNKSLLEVNVGARFNCQVLGLKKGSGERESIRMAPTASDVIEKDSIMIVLGKIKDIEDLQKEP